jgi:hypothetical protein
MDDQFNDDTTCGSIDSASRGMNITPRVNKNLFFIFQEIIFFYSYPQQTLVIIILQYFFHHHVQPIFLVQKLKLVYH